MPIVTETPVRGYVSCRDPRCAGYKERETEVVRRKQEFTYRELGGDLPGNEREAVDIIHAGESCPVCSGPQVYYEEPRPEYAPISGQDPLALLNLNQSGQIRDVQMQNLESAKELAEMRAMMAEMKSELDRRRGGRPRKDPEGE